MLALPKVASTSVSNSLPFLGKNMVNAAWFQFLLALYKKWDLQKFKKHFVENFRDSGARVLRGKKLRRSYLAWER